MLPFTFFHFKDSLFYFHEYNLSISLKIIWSYQTATITLQLVLQFIMSIS